MKWHNKKSIVLLCGALLSAPLMGMEQRSLWPRHLTPLIMEANYKSRKQFNVYILACVNKELSEDVPYENVRLTWESFKFDSPLSLIIEHRQELGVLYRDPLAIKKYLRVASRFLENKTVSNEFVYVSGIRNKMTLLQQAAYRGDKKLCKLFLEHGGNPYITTVRWEPQGPGYEWTAFDYANKHDQYGPGDDQPRGWLKELWDEVWEQ